MPDQVILGITIKVANQKNHIQELSFATNTHKRYDDNKAN